MSATPKGNHAHLTLSDRIYIEQALERHMKFKDIAIFIEKDSSTVSKEIRRHRICKAVDRKPLSVSCTTHAQRKICATIGIAINFAVNVLCDGVTAIARIIRLQCAAVSKRHPMSVTDVAFVIVVRISNIFTGRK